jgi:RecA-family ATPase
MAAPAIAPVYRYARPVSDLQARSVEWLWLCRLPLRKLVILDGDPGLGKSLIALDLCARLSTGQPFPDCSAGPGVGNAIVLCAEDGDEDTVRPRLQALGADLARVFVMPRTHSETAAPIAFPSALDILDKALTETGARLVVIDPIVAFLDASVIDGCDRSVRRALMALALLADKHDCVILLIRHLNKHGDSRSLYRGSGSIAFVAACRSAWLVTPHPVQADRRVLAQVKNNLAPPQPSLAYAVVRPQTGPATLRWEGPTPFTADQLLAASRPSGHTSESDRARDFLAAFLANGPRTSREVWAGAEENNLCERTIARAKQQLKIRSRIVGRGPDRVSYWLLEGQTLPETVAPVDPESDLEPWLKPIREMYPPATPLDDL